MKYAFICLAFCVCTFVGYSFSKKYTKRKKFFSSLIFLADKLSLEINFSRERLKVLIENFDETNKKNLLGLDEKFVQYLDKKIELDGDIFQKINILKPEEKDLILLFLKALGRSDVENQMKEIEGYISRFAEVKAVCDTEQKKYGSLSLKLGIDSGLFLAIIAAIGILTAVISQILKNSGKDDISTLATLAGVVIVLFMVIGMIGELFTTIKTIFSF